MTTDDFQQAERSDLEHTGLRPAIRFLEVGAPAVRVRVLETGDGPPVLFVPGDGAVAAAWAPLLAELHGVRAIVLDRPGFGLGDAVPMRGVRLRRHAVGLLTSVLDALGLDDVPIVGSSGGAQWGMWTALDAPARVRALVPMGTPAVCVPGFRPSAAMRLLTTPGVGDVLARLPSPSVAATGRMLVGTDARLHDHPEIVALYHAARGLPRYDATLAAVFQASMRAGGRPRRECLITDDELRRLAQPTLFVWGEQEPFGAPEAARRAAGLMPDARVEVVPGAWHHPWLADPAGIGRLVVDFLRRAS